MRRYAPPIGAGSARQRSKAGLKAESGMPVDAVQHTRKLDRGRRPKNAAQPERRQFEGLHFFQCLHQIVAK